MGLLDNKKNAMQEFKQFYFIRIRRKLKKK